MKPLFRLILVSLCSFSMMGLFGMCESEEHEGKEHAGTDHTKVVTQYDETGYRVIFSASEIKQNMTHYIAAKSNKNEGVYKHYDAKTGKTLSLKFVRIHDPVRKIEGRGYFACADFAEVGNESKLYDLDFWMNPNRGRLIVSDKKVHKDPVLVEGQWTKTPRYTFVNDNPVVVK